MLQEYGTFYSDISRGARYWNSLALRAEVVTCGWNERECAFPLL